MTSRHPKAEAPISPAPPSPVLTPRIDREDEFSRAAVVEAGGERTLAFPKSPSPPDPLPSPPAPPQIKYRVRASGAPPMLGLRESGAGAADTIPPPRARHPSPGPSPSPPRSLRPSSAVAKSVRWRDQVGGDAATPYNMSADLIAIQSDTGSDRATEHCPCCQSCADVVLPKTADKAVQSPLPKQVLPPPPPRAGRYMAYQHRSRDGGVFDFDIDDICDIVEGDAATPHQPFLDVPARFVELESDASNFAPIPPHLPPGDSPRPPESVIATTNVFTLTVDDILNITAVTPPQSRPGSDRSSPPPSEGGAVSPDEYDDKIDPEDDEMTTAPARTPVTPEGQLQPTPASHRRLGTDTSGVRFPGSPGSHYAPVESESPLTQGRSAVMLRVGNFCFGLEDVIDMVEGQGGEPLRETVRRDTGESMVQYLPDDLFRQLWP